MKRRGKQKPSSLLKKDSSEYQHRKEELEANRTRSRKSVESEYLVVLSATYSGHRWGDYTTALPDLSNVNATWTLGSYLDSSGKQHQWWMDISK
jgi:hypothetical protein